MAAWSLTSMVFAASAVWPISSLPYLSMGLAPAWARTVKSF